MTPEADRSDPHLRIDSACLAVIVVRDGRLPAGADEAACQADGSVLLVGSGVADAAERLAGARNVWLASSLTSPGSLCNTVAPLVGGLSLVVLPASTDGRDLAAVLSHRLGWPLLGGSVAASYQPEDGTVRVELLRVDGRVVVPAATPAPAVVTICPAARAARRKGKSNDARVYDLDRGSPHDASPTQGRFEDLDLDTLAVLAPEPSTMDLADARRVFAGGAGLVSRAAGDTQARDAFELLSVVASAVGASAGATRVISDAGWVGHERQIGTTGVSVDPDLYVAFGISGASQHIGGVGDADHVVSVNVDPSAPMARMANLAIVADAPAVLAEFARRLGVGRPPGLGETS